MRHAIALTAAYALLPLAATIIGAGVALLRAPGTRLRSGLQHFAAGVVFSVATVELLPTVAGSGRPLEVGISFSLGVLLMLGVEALVPAGLGTLGRLPGTLLIAVAVDVFIDGLLLGIGFALGAEAGRLLALALTLEALSLGLATTVSLLAGGARRSPILLIMSGVGFLFVLGSLLGAALLGGLSARALSLVLAFALAALLFLVTEELLAEAHETPDVPYVTALFFLGFLIFLVLGMLS